MANLVTYETRPDIPPIQMSNGLTSVFISVLSLAASALAESDWQREFAAWFASHDQGVCGLGVVGFDISELPWSPEAFVCDREFVLRVIDAAKTRAGWERLGYEPREEWVQACLDRFRAMVESFDLGHACRSESGVWRYARPAHLVLCPVHRVYQHQRGCVLCNDH
ncbi:MAG: hypothetical protein ACYC61_05320 [Isosphaeraceae bacterium]